MLLQISWSSKKEHLYFILWRLYNIKQHKINISAKSAKLSIFKK